MTTAHLAEVLARVTHRAPLFTRNQVRHIVQRQQYDCSRAQRELGIIFTPIEAALRDAITWYVENGWVPDAERLELVAAKTEDDWGVNVEEEMPNPQDCGGVEGGDGKQSCF
jgi:hypothetical protein